jgi:hypothetical protein
MSKFKLILKISAHIALIGILILNLFQFFPNDYLALGLLVFAYFIAKPIDRIK